MLYDAFISYSYAGDDLLSERVQRGLTRFAKPWWRRRALNVFRDQTALSANPGLWSSIAQAIDNSRYFVLLASPEAAASPWVAREVGQWRSQHGSAGLLILLTAGELVWNETSSDFDWRTTTALNASAFAGCFSEQPRHVDMSWARTEVQLDLTNGRFRDQIAELAAPMRGVAKDDLAGEDVQQHRRTLRHAWAAGVALALVTLAAIMTSAFAVNAAESARRSAARARTEQQRADAQATIAARDSEAAKQARSLAERKTALAVASQRAAARQKAVADQNAAEASQQQAAAQQSAAEATQQRDLAERQRLAGIATQLALGTQSALASRETDTAKLLAVQATKFAARSGGLKGDRELRPAFVNALQSNPRLIETLRGLSGTVTDVSVAASGSRAAAIASDGHVAVWSLPDRKLLSKFAVDARMTRVRLMTADSIVVAGGRSVICFQSADSGATWTRDWRWHTKSWTITAISVARQRVLVGAADLSGLTTIDLISAEGKPLRTVAVKDPVQRVALSPSGKQFAIAGIASGSPGSDRLHVHVFSLNSKMASFTTSLDSKLPSASRGYAADVRFAEGGRQIAVLAGRYDPPIYTWNLTTRQPILRQPGLRGRGTWATTVPDNPIALSPDFDAIVQRDPTDLNLVGVGHIETGRFTGNLWAGPEETANRGFGPSTASAFTPDGLCFLLPGGQGEVPVFALSDEFPSSHYGRAEEFAGSLAGGTLSPDGKLLATMPASAGSDILRITRLDGSKEHVDIALDSTDVIRAFGSRGDEIAVADSEGSIVVSDVSTGESRLVLAGRSSCKLTRSECGYSRGLAFSGSLDRGWIVETYGTQVWIWDLRAGTVVSSQAIDLGSATNDVFGGGPLFTASGTRLIVGTYPRHQRSQMKRIAHVFDATAHGWVEQRSFVTVSDDLWAVSPDGTQLAMLGGAGVTTYNLRNGAVSWRASGDHFGLWFAPDGTLYTQGGHGRIHARSAAAGRIEFTLDPLTPSARLDSPLLDSVVINDSSVITAWSEGVYETSAVTFGPIVVTQWPIAIDALAGFACAQSHRNLTSAEWVQYVGSFDPYEKTCADLP